jgi:hypothetical protein
MSFINNLKEKFNEPKFLHWVIIALLAFSLLSSSGLVSLFMSPFIFLLLLIFALLFIVASPFILLAILVISGIACLFTCGEGYVNRESKEEKIIKCIGKLKYYELYEDEKLRNICYSIK